MEEVVLLGFLFQPLPSAQEGHGAVGGGPEEATKMIRARAGTPLL